MLVGRMEWIENRAEKFLGEATGAKTGVLARAPLVELEIDFTSFVVSTKGEESY